MSRAFPTHLSRTDRRRGNGTRPRLSLTYAEGRRRTWRGSRRPSPTDTQLALRGCGSSRNDQLEPQVGYFSLLRQIKQPGLRSSTSPLYAGHRGGRGSRKAFPDTRSTQRGCCWSRTSAPARSAHPPSRSCRPNLRGQPQPLQWLSLGSFPTSRARGSYKHHINTTDS